MTFCSRTCRFCTSVAVFSFLVIWTICCVPAELAYLYSVWTGLSCSNEIWKYLVTFVLMMSTIGLIIFIALSGGLMISLQQSEYKIENLKRVIANRVSHNRRRRTRGSVRDSVLSSNSLPSYAAEETSGPPAYLDVIVENTNSPADS